MSTFCLLHSYRHHRHLHSFPTRRSSDLGQPGELLAKRLLLHDRIVQFGIRIGHFHAEHVQLEAFGDRSEEHTSELQSHSDLVCRLLLEKKKDKPKTSQNYMMHVQEITTH